MKKLLIAVLLITSIGAAEAQTRKVKEKELMGVWQMKIKLKEGLIEEEIEEEDNAFARMIAAGVGSFVEGMLDEIDVKFEFLPDGVCKVYAAAFDSDSDVDYTRWEINAKGELRIEDTDTYNSDGDDEYWLFEDDVLLLREKDGKPDEDAQVILFRID